jgi:hypothetical protein
MIQMKRLSKFHRCSWLHSCIFNSDEKMKGGRGWVSNVRGDEPFLMRDDVDAEFTLLVLDQVDVGVDTLGLIPPRQLGCNK